MLTAITARGGSGSLSLFGEHGTISSADLAEEDRTVALEEAPMTEGVIADLARERDRALRRLQVLAAEIRAHEDTMRRTIAPQRPADERLYRRLRQVNDGGHDPGEDGPPPVATTVGVRGSR